jgi:hypothetical protein
VVAALGLFDRLRPEHRGMVAYRQGAFQRDAGDLPAAE